MGCTLSSEKKKNRAYRTRISAIDELEEKVTDSAKVWIVRLKSIELKRRIKNNIFVEMKLMVADDLIGEQMQRSTFSVSSNPLSPTWTPHESFQFIVNAEVKDEVKVVLSILRYSVARDRKKIIADGLLRLKQCTSHGMYNTTEANVTLVCPFSG